MANGARRYQLKCASPNTRVFHPTTLISNSRSPGRQALSHPDFARYAYGRFAATLAWQMIDVVLGYQVWELTRKEEYLGLIGLAQFLPFVVLLLPGGQIADRFDRRLIIALAYGLELVAAVALLLFTLFGSHEVILLFFIAALLGVAPRFLGAGGPGDGAKPGAEGTAVRRDLHEHADVHHRDHQRPGHRRPHADLRHRLVVRHRGAHC